MHTCTVYNRKEFVSLIQEQAALSTNSRTGRKMNIGTITERIAMLENKDKQVTQVTNPSSVL